MQLDLAREADGVALMAIAAIAEAILMRNCAEQLSSLRRFAPWCLRLVASSNFWPLILLSAPMLFVLLVLILLFFGVDFHSMCPCSVYKYVGEVLKFSIAATQKTDVVGEL